ncbi:hypothetical protein P1J78_06655 [Psychromarinibacter sp. C21-152]|uniref:Uncharacterized protein n=1 Tax=Psychromarinibacter sediminicola TaxID=3033385 RepID=A0AAE3NRP0_9RHOB|nr:hypothetical protein [Psychromarinibacter sediminicola]MDF0600404.1 hypothetical protein [Psychromarinibacter sediminicola]
MISLDDIVDMCSLTREEIDAVGAHEHVEGVNAAALAEYMMHAPHGPQHVQQIICEDIRAALRADDLAQARKLFAVLHHYLSAHPEAVRGAEP